MARNAAVSGVSSQVTNDSGAREAQRRASAVRNGQRLGQNLAEEQQHDRRHQRRPQRCVRDPESPRTGRSRSRWSPAARTCWRSGSTSASGCGPRGVLCSRTPPGTPFSANVRAEMRETADDRRFRALQKTRPRPRIARGRADRASTRSSTIGRLERRRRDGVGVGTQARSIIPYFAASVALPEEATCTTRCSDVRRFSQLGMRRQSHRP